MREAWLIIHFIGLGIAFGTSVAILVLAKYNKTLAPEQRPIIGGAIRKLFMIGPMGLVLLIISGVFLLLPIWSAYTKNGLLHTKLTLVVVLIGLVGWGHAKMAKARKTGIPAAPPKIPWPLIVSTTIVVLAVLVFR